MRYLASIAAILVSTAASASVPPPPPAYLEEAMKTLGSLNNNEGAYNALFATSLVAEENGSVIARSKAAWIKWQREKTGHNQPKILGYAESGSSMGGDLLVVETFDTVRRDDLSAGSIADPRMETRSILYRFADDHKIYKIIVSSAKSFFMKS